MLSRTSCWLAAFKNKACNFRHISSKLIGCPCCDMSPRVLVCCAKTLYCSFFNPDFRGAACTRTAAQVGCQHIWRYARGSGWTMTTVILWGFRDRCSVLGKSLRYVANFDFASYGIIDAEIPDSDSTRLHHIDETCHENTVCCMKISVQSSRIRDRTCWLAIAL